MPTAVSNAGAEPDESGRRVQLGEFPHFASAQEKLQFLLDFTALTPSVGDKQPWLWQINDDQVDLWADCACQMSVLEDGGRELVISCGVALQHLRLAICACGYSNVIAVLPDVTQPNLLARVRLCKAHQPLSDDELLFRYINQRHTAPCHFVRRALPADLLQALQAEAQQEGAWLHYAQSATARAAIADLSELSARLSRAESELKRDILGFGDFVSQVAPFAFHVGAHDASGAAEARRTGNTPVWVVLGTPTDGVAAWLAAGQALGRVLLRSCVAGIGASFFNQPVEVAAALERVREALGIRPHVQLIFRLGYVEPDTSLVAAPIKARP